MNLEEIYAPAQKDLERFSDILKKELASDDALITNIHNHLLKMTGKFLRPALTLLSSKLGPKDKPVEAAKLSAAIELIHTATLIHDDIIDNSELRRNMPSVHSKWGRDISIVSGDYLYAKAFMLLASLKDVYLNQALAACAHVMCEGEMKQIEKRTDFLMTEEEYLKIIHQKTAALFQASCMGGAYLAGLDLTHVRKLGDYGYNLGMAFQIVDDCLDLVGETQTLGKTAGLDVYKNDVTLPLLYLFQNINLSRRAELLRQIETGHPDPGILSEIQKLAKETRAIEQAMAKARQYIEKAHEALQGIAASPSKDSLENLALFCIERAR